ncbi:tubby-related protein 4-like [Amphibalanus amphitrite]|nr:tubby-related protein 4-like [Amphibalanus amphitrite]
MHFHLEKDCRAESDCPILSLSWMGRVPNELIEQEGSWRLNRSSYYQEGWLATGNARAIAGVTFTSSHSRKHTDLPVRTNYNLRGHRSQIVLVRWNEPYQKLATCDSSGIIFVWIKYEGRWSIELINDRSTPVTHFSWSHDGRMALICYQDGFVLVGSVAGQRYWSSNLRLSSNIVCGTWTPDDQQVFFGSLTGQLVVMDVHGAMVSNVTLLEGVPVLEMSWNCEKFKMEERDDTTAGSGKRRQLVLAVSFENGLIHLMNSYDDVLPVVVRTGLLGIKMEWCNSGELLAVAGQRLDGDSTPGVFTNLVHFYTSQGERRYISRLPCRTCGVTALTWGHNGRRLFIATGAMVHVAWIGRRVAPLQLLCRLSIKDALATEEATALLPLPRRVKLQLAGLFSPTLRSHIPDTGCLRQFIAQPPDGSTRLHCTMIRNEDDFVTSSAMYTLYLEHFGGLIPLLKGKRTSKIRPEFIIFDPSVSGDAEPRPILTVAPQREATAAPPSDSSDTEEERCHTPRTARRRWRRRAERETAGEDEPAAEPPELRYQPGSATLAQVTSNIWGTKFRVLGVAPNVAPDLGQISYKTSLLHLQPRQMTLVMTELSRRRCAAGSSAGLPGTRRGSRDDDRDERFRHRPSQASVGGSEAGARPCRTGVSLSLSRPAAAESPPPPPPSRDRGRAPVIAADTDDEAAAAPELDHLRESLLRMKHEMDAKMRPEPPPDPVSSKVRVLNGLNALASPRRAARSQSVNRADRARCHVVSHGRTGDAAAGGDLAGRRTSSAPAGEPALGGAVPPTSRPEPTPAAGGGSQMEAIKFIDDDGEDERPVAPRIPPNRSQSLNFISGHGVTLDMVAETASAPRSRVVLIPRPSRRLKRVKSHSLGAAPSGRLGDWLTDSGAVRQKKQPPPTGTPAGAGRAAVLHAEAAVRAKLRVPEELRGCHSSPVTPVARRKERKATGTPPISRRLLSSPLLCRRRMPSSTESSEDESAEVTRSQPFTSLESLQRSQVRNKLRRGIRDSSQAPEGAAAPSPPTQRRQPPCRQLIMHNIAPLWNESSQVYQLDFGGRVTQESAKNFQIQYCGDQVMQFGRIDGNAYTLDFQYPFSAVQAFAVALANVTQRFK